jgi:hypothetical protein
MIDSQTLSDYRPVPVFDVLKPEPIAKIQEGVPSEAKLDPNGPEPPLHVPGFKGMLTDDQMNDLVTYLISLKPKGEESGF